MTDDIDQRLINALMADSRLSLKALAQVSGLSAPSVAERLRKLEERGVIRSYTLDVDPAVSATSSRRSCASAPARQAARGRATDPGHRRVHRVRQGHR